MDGKTQMELLTQFHSTIGRMLRQIHDTQSGVICRAGIAICEAVRAGGSFFATGTGHSHMLAEELYTRAGGLACVTPLLPGEFMLSEHPLKSTAVERVPAYADVVLSVYGISAGDILLLASNSGRNGMIVELAIKARQLGAKVISISSIAGTMGQTSRHPGGKKLWEVSDIAIDNCGVEGDAVCAIAESGSRMGATSTVTGAYIVQQLSMAVAVAFRAAGEEPPIFLSSNVDGADDWNRVLFRDYYHV